MSENRLYSKTQSAYRENHSTETALLRVHNDIMIALDARKDVVLVMLDLSAAFDTLDHNILLNRLQHHFGITGTVLDWFRSYLKDRVHRVSINSTTSTEAFLRFGVPQGSVLGPLLFTLYITPLDEIITSHGLDNMLFADDSQIYIVCNSPQDVKLDLESCVENVRQWMRSNMLILNDGKTEVIQFSSRYKRDVTKLDSLRIGTCNITPSTKVKNLGATIDSDGSMACHINNVCKSSFFALSKIGKIRTLIDSQTTERLIHAFVTSRLDYCNSLLYGIPNYQLEKLQSIQNAAARLVTRTKKFEHISPILYRLHWLPVKERIKFKIALFTFKILRGECPIYLNPLVDVRVPERALRSTNRLLLTRRDTRSTTVNYGHRAFSISAPLLWNELPFNINCLDLSCDVFKSQLKTYLFTEHFNTFL